MVRDSVGEGGRDMFAVVCGVRLSHNIESSNLVGEEGGVNSRVEKYTCVFCISSYAGIFVKSEEQWQ